jgi:penicillin-binding protein 1C
MLAFVLMFICLEYAVRSTPVPDALRASNSNFVLSSSGELLWAFRTPDDKLRLSTAKGDVDEKYINLLIQYEDKRFRNHNGVDIAALVRAGVQSVSHSRLAGASTITMQVSRLLEPKPRTIICKLDQIFKALKLERVFTKDEILEIYLTRAPFGGNIEGVRAAALTYFGKEPKKLSLAEAATLVALPQSPETRRPDHNATAARVARNRVLEALSRRGLIDAEAAAQARRASMEAAVHSLTRSAPHLAIRLRSRSAGSVRGRIDSLIDFKLQRHTEQVVRRAITRWDDAVNIAAIVLRNQDASVVSYVGGVDLTADSRSGFVDVVQAVRSPGSALKPFIYSMAFEKLIVHPETIISDEPIDIGGYRPENSDGAFSGDISIRRALVRSRNTTAVMLLDKVGVDSLLARFRSAGRPLLLPNSGTPAGLAVALGGVGVTLEQLTWFYTIFANEGRLNGLRLQPIDPIISLGQFVSPNAATATADILADVPPPPGYAKQLTSKGGRRVGLKTGTSYGFRDAWAVGFDKLHTVGVWVGRPDGASHFGAYGATAASPIVLQIFDRLAVPDEDAGASKTSAGPLLSNRELPLRLARFTGSQEQNVRRHLEIIFPRNGSNIRTDLSADKPVPIPLTVAGGSAPYQWTLPGAVQPPSHSLTTQWSVMGRGQFDIMVQDATGAIAKSSFWLE